MFTSSRPATVAIAAMLASSLLHHTFALSDQCGPIETNTDYYGDDIAHFTEKTLDECCDLCPTTRDCAAFTFLSADKAWDGKSHCWLKVATGVKKTKVGATSGVPSCTAEIGDGCGNDATGRTCCPTNSYCLPLDQYYYQCVSLPSQCSTQLTNIDFRGYDMGEKNVTSADECCDACAETPGCKAYVYENRWGSKCYLKSNTVGRTATSGLGLVSGIVDSPLAATPANCPAKKGEKCGNRWDHGCCPTNNYCMAWDENYYQCITVPDKCSAQLTDVDFYGNDMKTVIFPMGSLPDKCCDECAKTPGCVAYSLVNADPRGPACYLKSSTSGQVTKPGVVSGTVDVPLAATP